MCGLRPIDHVALRGGGYEVTDIILSPHDGFPSAGSLDRGFSSSSAAAHRRIVPLDKIFRLDPFTGGSSYHHQDTELLGLGMNR